MMVTITGQDIKNVQAEGRQYGKDKAEEEAKRLECEAKGGEWNTETKVCRFTQGVRGSLNFQRAEKEKELKTHVQDGVPGITENGVFFADNQAAQQKVIFDEQDRATGLVQPSGQTLLGLSPDEVSGILQPGATAADAQQQTNLAGQVGQFDQLGVTGTPFDGTALAGAAARGVIPGLIGAATGAIGAGIIGAKVGAVGGPAGAITLGALGFASGIASTMLAEAKGQRTDNTNSQQRVLDEGKQFLNDWITFAEANPSQKMLALNGFNKQLALIEQAHSKMKLDTQQDVLSFESAIPNLAEFTAFYSVGGEKNIYTQEMMIAMSQPDVTIDTRMLDLINRRKP